MEGPFGPLVLLGRSLVLVSGRNTSIRWRRWWVHIEAVHPVQGRSDAAGVGENVGQQRPPQVVRSPGHPGRGRPAPPSRDQELGPTAAWRQDQLGGQVLDWQQ